MAEEVTPAVEEVVSEVVVDTTVEETPAVEEVVVSKNKSKKTTEEVVETPAVEEVVFNEVSAARAEAVSSITTVKQPTPGMLIALSNRERK